MRRYVRKIVKVCPILQHTMLCEVTVDVQEENLDWCRYSTAILKRRSDNNVQKHVRGMQGMIQPFKRSLQGRLNATHNY